MANLTYYVVLPFVRDDETNEFVAEQGQEVHSESTAVSRARAMIGRKVGAIAFRRSENPALGNFDDVLILRRYGETPHDLAGFTSMA